MAEEAVKKNPRISYGMFRKIKKATDKVKELSEAHQQKLIDKAAELGFYPDQINFSTGATFEYGGAETPSGRIDLKEVAWARKEWQIVREADKTVERLVGMVAEALSIHPDRIDPKTGEIKPVGDVKGTSEDEKKVDAMIEGVDEE